MLFDKIYIIPNYECSLDCPHCQLHKKQVEFNGSKFYEMLESLEAKEFVLFGGEPTLYKDRLERIIATNKITSISTNLILEHSNMECFKTIIKDKDISIATSWNLHRFPLNLIDIWFKNLEILQSISKKPILLITLTKDLFENYSSLRSILDKLDKENLIEGVLFEHYIGSEATEEYNKKSDEFLCKVYKNWYWSFNNFIINRLDNWNCNCSKILTLEPNGNLKSGCPQFEGLVTINNKCLDCKLASICNPCYLQTNCSFPKQLYELVQKDRLNGCYN